MSIYLFIFLLNSFEKFTKKNYLKNDNNSLIFIYFQSPLICYSFLTHTKIVFFLRNYLYFFLLKIFFGKLFSLMRINSFYYFFLHCLVLGKNFLLKSKFSHFTEFHLSRMKMFNVCLRQRATINCLWSLSVKSTAWRFDENLLLPALLRIYLCMAACTFCTYMLYGHVHTYKLFMNEIGLVSGWNHLLMPMSGNM